MNLVLVVVKFLCICEFIITQLANLCIAFEMLALKVVISIPALELAGNFFATTRLEHITTVITFSAILTSTRLENGATLARDSYFCGLRAFRFDQ